MTTPTAPIAPPPRVIRVFVSSTFRDMNQEREELVKRVFPELRKLCEERGVTWSEVDLRWGITEEQTERGEVLPICLAEIQRCRPYFIGLLGERYGWVPEEIPDELIDQEPWLAEHLHHSVTELEILHGVLNTPKMTDHALFYFRDRAYIDSLPPDEQPDYLELPTKEEIERLRRQEAGRRAEERKHKLAALKKRIKDHGKASGMPVRENYPNPRALGEMVLGDLTEVIDRLYPKGSEPDPLDREALDHEAFVQRRAKVYIGRQSYYDRLDEHARGDGPPLVVLGESGSGKSALLSNWALRYRSAHPEEMLLMHFIGATPFSADWTAMLSRLMAELKRRFDIQQEIPEDPDELRAAFANWLHMAAARGRVVLILDALDQLEDRDAAPDLLWLPPEIPPNVRLIVSTLPGRPLDALTKRGWPTLKVTLLQPRERLKLLWKYLKQYSKRLNKPRRRRIAIADHSSNPLYLRALLDELRVFGVHEQLDSRIEHYLTAMTADKLYGKILERYEQDYERDRPGLVRDAMSLLWAARRGLSETELLELLGENSEPLPRAHWSPLYLAAEQSLVTRSGLVGFGHDYLHQAVRDRYLFSAQQQREAHLRLAAYFESQALGPRKVDELPWQLGEAGSWQRLCDVLTNRPFFAAAWAAEPFEVKTHWARIEAGSSLRVVEAYRTVLDAPTEDPQVAWCVAMLLADTGHTEDAFSVRTRLVTHFREIGDLVGLRAALGAKAVTLKARGELDEAMRLHREQERLCRMAGDNGGLQVSIGNQANILKVRGALDEATRLYGEQERLCRELGDKEGLNACLGNQAMILETRGELAEAMRLHKEAEQGWRELDHKIGLQSSLCSQAIILRAWGERDDAMRLLKEQERICIELGFRDGLSRSLGNQAMILADRGERDEAMRLHKEEERICRELGNKEGLQASLGNQGVILEARGELDEAMRLHKEEEHICRDLGFKEGLSACLGNQANILKARGDLDEALRLHTEQERLCRELGNRQWLAVSLGGKALVVKARGDLDEAMRLLKEQEELCRELGSRGGLSGCLANQATILEVRGDLDEAMRLFKDQEQLCRASDDTYGLQFSLGRQALIHKARGDLDEAARLLDEQARLCRALGNKDAMAQSLGSQASLLHARGELDAALRLLKEQETLCRELGNKDGLSACLGNQAVILDARGQPDEAMRLHGEEERLCRELGDKDGLQSSLGNQAMIRRGRGELNEATRLYAEQERLCRELGNTEGLALSLINRACLWAGDMGRPREALPAAEESYRLATTHGLIALAEQIRPILEHLRSQAP